ncbi:MAG: hypothetical protein GY913_19690 [Proteobacteria bacterium]|nr:hypothetical protein [Pseudomonadota bacterium]
MWLLSTALAAPVSEPLPDGWIDWTQGVLVVESSGDPNTGAWSDVKVAEQAALAQLELRIEEHARNVAYDSDTVASELMVDGPWARSVREGATTWKIVESRYHSSGRVELRAELDIHTWLRPVLADQAAAPSTDKTPGVTGVLVDAREVRASPCLAPKLVGPDRAVAYSAASLSEVGAAGERPAVWVGDPADAEAVERVGDNPLILVAASASGCDLVLDGQALASLNGLAGTDVLTAGRVAVVVTP